MPAVFGAAGGTEEEMKADFYCPDIGWPLPSMYISVDIARWSNPHTCSVVSFISWREGGWQCCSFSSVCKVTSSISNTGQVCPLCSKSSKNKTVLAGSSTWIVFSTISWRENGNVFPFFLKKKIKSLGLTLTQFPNMDLQKCYSLNLLDSTSQRWISKPSGPDGSNTRRKCFKSNVISWNQMCSMPWKMDSVISTLHLARLIF